MSALYRAQIRTELDIFKAGCVLLQSVATYRGALAAKPVTKNPERAHYPSLLCLSIAQGSLILKV